MERLRLCFGRSLPSTLHHSDPPKLTWGCFKRETILMILRLILQLLVHCHTVVENSYRPFNLNYFALIGDQIFVASQFNGGEVKNSFSMKNIVALAYHVTCKLSV